MDNLPENTALIKVNTGLERVNKQIAITSKLLQATDPILIPYRKKDKWGFCTPDKKIVIECIYDFTIPFHENLNLAGVRSNRRWGFINHIGQELISCKYENICWKILFRENLAHVKLDDKWGFIDKFDMPIIPFKYDVANCFHEGLARVKLNGKYGLINKNNEEVIPIIYDNVYNYFQDLAVVSIGGEYWYIDRAGKKTSDIKYEYADRFSESLARIKSFGKWGFIDKNEKSIIENIYDDAGDFSENRAKVKYNEKCGYIDKSGKQVIGFIYDDAKGFSEGLAAVQQNGKWGFIDIYGNQVTQCIYDEAYFFSKDLALVKLNRWGFIDKSGVQYWEDDPHTDLFMSARQRRIKAQQAEILAAQESTNKSTLTTAEKSSIQNAKAKTIAEPISQCSEEQKEAIMYSFLYIAFSDTTEPEEFLEKATEEWQFLKEIAEELAIQDLSLFIEAQQKFSKEINQSRTCQMLKTITNEYCKDWYFATAFKLIYIDGNMNNIEREVFNNMLHYIERPLI